MRKRLSGGQKWFLRPYFSLIRGMFVFRSCLRFSFQAPEVPEPRVRKSPQKQPKIEIIAKIDFWGLNYPLRCLLNLKHVVQYAGHINKTFWTIKIWLGRQVGCGTVKIWTKIALILPHIALYFKLPWPPLPTLSNLCGSKWRVDVSRIYVVCFKFNQLLRGSFRPQKSILAIIANFGYFWGLFLALSLGTSGSRNENLRPLFNTNIPSISGKYGLRTHF